MTEHEELWLESKVRDQIEQWCAELGWNCESLPWGIEITAASPCQSVVAEWKALEKGAAVQLLLLFNLLRYRVTVPPRMLWFVLRRNEKLDTIHWCIGRNGGLAIRALRELATLTRDGFRRTVVHLHQELNALLALVEQDAQRTVEGRPTDAGAEVGVDSVGCANGVGERK